MPYTDAVRELLSGTVGWIVIGIAGIACLIACLVRWFNER